jgi:hypothetical protein
LVFEHRGFDRAGLRLQVQLLTRDRHQSRLILRVTQSRGGLVQSLIDQLCLLDEEIERSHRAIHFRVPQHIGVQKRLQNLLSLLRVFGAGVQDDDVRPARSVDPNVLFKSGNRPLQRTDVLGDQVANGRQARLHRLHPRTVLFGGVENLVDADFIDNVLEQRAASKDFKLRVDFAFTRCLERAHGMS